MDKNCGSCTFYEAIPGDPPAGYCRFMERESLPYWMDKFRTRIENLGADVLASDGDECEAHKPE